MKNLNHNTDLRIFLITLFSLIFFSTTSIYAQKSENPAKVEPAIVVLKEGAKIYSTDEAFNKQIQSNAVILKNAELDSKKVGLAKILTVKFSKPERKKDFRKEIKIAEEKKQQEELKKVKKEIEKHKERKETFRKSDFSDFPSPLQFFSSNSSLKNYIAPGHNGNEFSKIDTSQKDYSVKRALDYLHAAKYIHYNNKSLDFCFSQVYSVRPPPAFYFS